MLGTAKNESDILKQRFLTSKKQRAKMKIMKIQKEEQDEQRRQNTYFSDDFLNIYAIFVAYICLSWVFFLYMKDVDSEPYIDEIFHVPQAQRFCDGNFSYWDEKITTLPGLYLSSMALWLPVCWLFEQVSCCAITQLRLTNVFFGAVNVLLLWYALKILHPRDQPLERTLNVMNISLFPVLYFFSFLFYTEQGSTCFVLLLSVSSRKKSKFFTIISGVGAVLMRQTNIIWIFFQALLEAETWLWKEFLDLEDREVEKLRNYSVETEVREIVFQLYSKVKSMSLWQFLVKCVSLCVFLWHYVLLGALFISFTVVNNGIVVGDRTAHTPVMHLSQLFYCALFCALWASPLLLFSLIFDYDKWCRILPTKKFQFWATLVLVIAAVSFWKFNYVHPYLLADNRHYSHILWRRVLSKNFFRLLALPFCVLSAFLLALELRYRGVLFNLAYLLCVILVVVPQRMLEFRYFIMPYIMWRLHARPAASKWALIFEFALYGVTDVLTLYVYGHFPITEGWEPGKIQHYMW